MAQASLRGSGDIDSGYTYLGQFIAHDISKLPPVGAQLTSIAEIQQNCTPMLDLDSVYGDGFDDLSVPVDHGTGAMLLGCTVDVHGRPVAYDDLPRDGANRKARIGDDRNDGNLLLAQLHVQFLKLHNYLIGRLAADHPAWNARRLYQAARHELVLHYQDVVLYDYLPKVLDRRTWKYLVADKGEGVCSPAPGEPLGVPVEFSAAALRFGHSMVRLKYGINENEATTLRGLFTMTGAGGFDGASALPAVC